MTQHATPEPANGGDPSPPNTEHLSPVSQLLRRVVQAFFLFLFLSPLLGLTRIDVDHRQLVLLGLGVPVDKLFLLVSVGFFAFVGLFFLSSRRGRIFCAYACPVHFFLERINRPKQLVPAWLLAALFPVLLTESVTAFALPFGRQLEIFRAQTFPQPIIMLHLVPFFVLGAVFLVYRERACRLACPYAIMQSLTQTDQTAVMQFTPEGCIDCGRCDRICPYILDVRKECDDALCSNCGLCQQECRKALGPGNEVLHLVREVEEE